MKVIFLDIDGVLNSTTSTIIRHHLGTNDNMHYVSEENFNLLKILVDEANAHIVISSTWRKDRGFIEQAQNEKDIIEKFRVFFKEHGWENAPIIGITPNLSGFRGEEVATYLDGLSKTDIIEDYIIIDDDSDFILSDLKEMNPIRLDRMKIYSEEDLYKKSLYWSNQKFYQIDRNTGLTLKNVYEILNNFDKNNNLVKDLKDVLSWKKF